MNIDEYVLIELNKSYKCDNVLYMLDLMKKGQRVIFTKFGDGEFLNMTTFNGHNCDGDRYTYEFGMHLNKVFIQLCNMSAVDNIFIGKWHTEVVNRYLISLLYDNTESLRLIYIPFVNYHFVMPDTEYHKTNHLYEFMKTIQEHNKYKIIIGNNKNRRLQIIFKGNIYIEIPQNCWYSNGFYNVIKETVQNILREYNDATVIIAGGMASKILICELGYEFRGASFIDIGSAYDILASKEDTRQWYKAPNTEFIRYEKQIEYFKDLLPIDFI